MCCSLFILLPYSGVVLCPLPCAPHPSQPQCYQYWPSAGSRVYGPYKVGVTYIRMCVCTYTHSHMDTRTHMHTWIQTRTQTQTRTHTYKGSQESKEVPVFLLLEGTQPSYVYRVPLLCCVPTPVPAQVQLVSEHMFSVDYVVRSFYVQNTKVRES